MNSVHAIQALPVTTTLRLTAADLVAFDVQPGDRLRSDGGSVWITVNGQLRDVVIDAGQVHTVDEAARLHVSALQTARLVVIGRAPARWQREGEQAVGTAGPLRDWLAAGLRRLVSGTGRRRWAPQVASRSAVLAT